MLGLVSTIVSSNLGKLFMMDIGINWGAFVVANHFQTDKFYDLTGSLTFLGTAFLSYKWSHQTPTQTVQTGMVMAWASRLGLFLFTRVMKDGKDSRFDEIKQSPSRFFVAWTLQGLWVFITLLPTLMLNESSPRALRPPIGWQSYLGWSMWTLGFLFEVVADWQKSTFKADPANKGQFINTGLWSLSQHPNYFGEILLWSGLFVAASSVFRGSQYLAVLSPVFIHLLITRVSGIPMLKEAGMKRWGDVPEYKEYLKNTPELVPFTKKFW